MRRKIFTIVVLVAATTCAKGQVRQQQTFVDSSSSRLHQIQNTNVGEVGGFFQSGFTPSIGGFSNAGDVNALCGRAYRNLTGVPITVTIVPGSSKDRISYLFVKQDPSAQWVLMAYSQNSIPTSVQIRDGAVYCPTMNENGYFYVTILNGGAQASLPQNYAAQYLFWSDEAVQPGLHVEDPTHGCLDIVATRTFYSNGVAGDRRYMVRYGANLIPARGIVVSGACPPPPPIESGQ